MATTPEETGRIGITGARLALVVVGLLALLAVLWFVFLRGDGEELAAPPPALAVATPDPEPTEDAAQRTNRRRGRVETFEVFASKDPFDPLVEPGGGGGGETLGSAQGGESGTGTTSLAGTSSGTESVGGHRVRVVDVFTANNGEQRAQIQVDGTVYTVEEGETFADSFQLLSLSGDCATMLFGDDQFTICEGEEIIK